MVLNHFGKKSISAEACESIIGQAHILKKTKVLSLVSVCIGIVPGHGLLRIYIAQALYVVTLYSKYSRALNFEDDC
jgi:hypothetical protein